MNVKTTTTIQLLDALAQYNIGITALQEVRFGGSDIIRDKRRKSDIYYSGREKQGLYGVGFVVRGNLRNSVMGWCPISERVCAIRMKGTFYNTSIICAYAPTDTSKTLSKQQLEINKDEFYDELDAALGSCPKHDVKYVIGDFNAKIGKEEVYLGTIGRHSKHHTSTDNGCRLINLARARSKQHLFSS